jgi:hypothetical protein
MSGILPIMQDMVNAVRHAVHKRFDRQIGGYIIIFVPQAPCMGRKSKLCILCGLIESTLSGLTRLAILIK